MKLERDEKRSLKTKLRKPKARFTGKTRYLVSVWIDEDSASPYWLEDMRFKYPEDAKVHAARWGRIYGATVTQISEVEI